MITEAATPASQPLATPGRPHSPQVNHLLPDYAIALVPGRPRSVWSGSTSRRGKGGLPRWEQITRIHARATAAPEMDFCWLRPTDSAKPKAIGRRRLDPQSDSSGPGPGNI